MTHSTDKESKQGSQQLETITIFLSNLWSRRSLLIRNFLIASVVFSAITLMMPKTFRATTTLMPPTSDRGFGMLDLAMSSSPLSAFMGAGSSTEAMSTIAILESRTLAQAVIDSFGLLEFYDAENMEEALRVFSESYVIDISDEGTIRVDFYLGTSWFSDKENDRVIKGLAADIANLMVQELDVLNKSLKTEKAKFNRLFIEDRYLQNVDDLRQAEEEMRTFQKKHNMVALEEQTTATISAAAEIQAQIIMNDVKIQTLLNSFNADHPQVSSLQKEVETLKQKLSDIEQGKNISDILPGFKSVPDLGFEYARLFREIEIQNEIFIFLTQQYEEAKIQEAKDTPTVQVLDPAYPPERKSRPRRSLLVLFWVSIVMLATIFYINYTPLLKQLASDIRDR